MRHPGLINEINEKNPAFEWSKENFNKIELLIKKYPNGKIPFLHRDKFFN